MSSAIFVLARQRLSSRVMLFGVARGAAYDLRSSRGLAYSCACCSHTASLAILAREASALAACLRYKSSERVHSARQGILASAKEGRRLRLRHGSKPAAGQLPLLQRKMHNPASPPSHHRSHPAPAPWPCLFPSNAFVSSPVATCRLVLNGTLRVLSQTPLSLPCTILALQKGNNSRSPAAAHQPSGGEGESNTVEIVGKHVGDQPGRVPGMGASCGLHRGAVRARLRK